MKTKIILEQGYADPKQYVVIKLTNRVVPEIGKTLTREEVQKLQTDSDGLTIEIVPHRRSNLRK